MACVNHSQAEGDEGEKFGKFNDCKFRESVLLMSGGIGGGVMVVVVGTYIIRRAEVGPCLACGLIPSPLHPF
jgi:hypothetical protein